MHIRQSVGLVVLVCASFATLTRAQTCQDTWLPGHGYAGTDGTVYAVRMWDPDGAGPTTPKLVVGGAFGIAGDALARTIATYDPDTGAWSSLGDTSGSTGARVEAVATLPNGDLLVGGLFTSFGGVTLRGLARWDGNAWSPIGSGTNAGMSGTSALANAILVASDGSVYIGGGFPGVGGIAANNIVRWSPTTGLISPLGSGVGGTVNAIAELPSGEIIVGGAFSTAGGAQALRIAKWDGTNWSAFGSGFNHVVNATVVLPTGELIVGGYFTDVDGVAGNDHLLRWTGSGWASFASPSNQRVASLRVAPNGDLLVCRESTNVVERYRGTALVEQLPSPSGQIFTMETLPNGDLVVGGGVFTSGSQSLLGVARWNGATWTSMNPGADVAPSVFSAASLPNGQVVVGGNFDLFGGAATRNVARWSPSLDGTGPGTWTAFAAGSGGPNGTVNAVAVLPSGDIVIAGGFSTPVNRVGRWNGATWVNLGTGISGTANALAVDHDGSLLVGGNFTTAGGQPAARIARWSPAASSWSSLGSGIGDGGVNAVLPLGNGDVVVGGTFTVTGTGSPASRIARWNAATMTWTGLGSGAAGDVEGLALHPSGDVIACGGFSSIGGTPNTRFLGRWNGLNWAPIGAGVPWPAASPLKSVLTLPNGDVVTGGSSVTTLSGLARWNGVSWNPLVSGIDTGAVYALARMPNSDLAVGGNFTSVSDRASVAFARFHLGEEAPIVLSQPQPLSICPSANASLTVGSRGAGPLSFQWRRDGVAIPSASNPSAVLPTLLLSAISSADNGMYDCVITNTCGSATTQSVRVVMCPPDINCSGGITVQDVFDFLIAWFGSIPSADFNGVGGVTIQDVFDFLTAWFAGC